VADLAILSIDAVDVPIYATNSAEESRYILEHSESVMCLCGTRDHMNKIFEVKKKLPKLKKLVVFDQVSEKKKDMITLKEAFKIGAAYKKRSDFDKRLKGINPKKLATIIYTSGTTGNPKGVMLTHDNFISNTRQIFTKFGEYMDGNHRLMSFLPLSHSLERTCGYYLPMSIGATVAFARDFATIIQDLQDYNPTFIISVPRLYEKIHSTILSRLPSVSIVKQSLFKLSQIVATHNVKYECNNLPRPALFNAIFSLFDKIIFSKLKAGLGMGNIQFAVSGGAPLSRSDAEFFIGMGIKILEGFGLTETTPVTNVNPLCRIKPGTVGPALPETQIKISDEGELLIKGPQVMPGYYKNKKATQEVFTKDGFFRTGDIGVIDDEGFLSITGRIKDIIVTAGGKNISPQNIEGSLKSSKFIEQIAIIGDRRKYLTALVIPAFNPLQAWAKTSNIEFSDSRDLITKPEVIKLYENEILEYTKHYSRVEQIRKFTLLDAEWTQETGELTPSLKIKRQVLEQKYAQEIEGMYPPE
jgi:long-chain acyl-CoA synthetase